ncbi:Protein of unknown function [Cotesia congregata]|uniref:Uncharacterized protein n=1 Tax=Cotesia congregata TaxID=51543 RepID=A0A8J2HP54_COTCN|nr:Protein of unknown function [Cotesia congregata]
MHDNMPPDRWLNDTEIHVLLSIICDESFIRYRLREINGDRFIGENYPGSILIESTNNQLWEENLRKKCNELIEDIGAEKMYNYWKEWYAGYDRNFRTILCRGDVGILRECRSFKDVVELPALEDDEDDEDEEEDSDYGIKINAKLECTYD